VDPVVKELDSKRVTGENQTSLAGIPDRQTEHPIEAVEDIVAPLLVTVDDYLCVRSGTERVAVRFELARELQEVVNFAVEHHPNGSVAVRHGLVAASQIDDGEPAKAEAEWSHDIVPLVIRASVDKGLGHHLDVLAKNGSLTPKIVLSANAAHRLC